MSDKVELQKPLHPRYSTKIEQVAPFRRQGKEASTSVVDITLVRTDETTGEVKERYVGRFLRKRLRDAFKGNVPEAQPSQQLEKYTRLKKLDLPVLSTFKASQEMRSIYMTYVRGGCEVFDNHYPMKEEDRARITNLDEIEEQVRSIAKIAFDNGNGVFLSLDAYTVIVDQSGHAEIMLLDLGYGSRLLNNGMSDDGETWYTNEQNHEANDFIREVIHGEAPTNFTWFG